MSTVVIYTERGPLYGCGGERDGTQNDKIKTKEVPRRYLDFPYELVFSNAVDIKNMTPLSGEGKM